MACFHDPGENAENCSVDFLKNLRADIDVHNPTVVFVHTYFSNDNDNNENQKRLFEYARELLQSSRACIIADSRNTPRWGSIIPTRCRGDLAFACNVESIGAELLRWAEENERGNPHSIDDIEGNEFADLLGGIAEDYHLDQCVDAAFVGTEEAAAESEPIDAILEPGDLAPDGPDEETMRDDENDLLEKVPLPGHPLQEKERRAKWLALPRRTRIAIRRLHRNFKHLPKNALVQLLRASRSPKEYIDAAKAYRCDVCEINKPLPTTHKVSMPRPYEFNAEVGIDVLEIKDSAGRIYDVLNIVDYGTTFEQAFIVREADINGSPSSQKCLEAFTNGWVRPFGWPRYVALDRGSHNRGIFSFTLLKKGVRIRSAALESPEQIGRVERRNQTLKRLIDKVVKETSATGRSDMEMILTECIVTINEMTRHGGFAPVQWVLSRFPRSPATLGDEDERMDIGAIQAHVDGPTSFALQSEYRLQARKAFVQWDCGRRVQRGILRNAAPVPGPYKVGDIVSYRRQPRSTETGTQWSVGSRIIGFEVDHRNPNKTPETAWVICNGLPVCVATDKIRPCTAAE